METIYKAGLVGISGYTGMELARALITHPHINLVMATSRQEKGKTIQELYPFLRSFTLGNLVIEDNDPKQLADTCDVVFLAVPHGVAMDTAAQILDHAAKQKKDIKVVDLSADFRIKDTKTYEDWYHVPHTQSEYLKEAVYGLVDLYEDDIKNARLVANPGCYPSASILGLYPALLHKCIETDSIVIDAKSGTTGAGRKAVVSSLFCEVHDSFKPYGLGGKHRHTPEIEQELALIAKEDMTISFNPHLLPMHRGILATIYTKLKDNITQEEIHSIYEKTYGKANATTENNTQNTNEAHVSKHAKFIRVLPSGQLPETRYVRGSMFCDIGITVDQRTKRLIITVAIDNLARGASLQAIANANLMLGLALETGIDIIPLCP